MRWCSLDASLHCPQGAVQNTLAHPQTKSLLAAKARNDKANQRQDCRFRLQRGWDVFWELLYHHHHHHRGHLEPSARVCGHFYHPYKYHWFDQLCLWQSSQHPRNTLVPSCPGLQGSLHCQLPVFSPHVNLPSVLLHHISITPSLFILLLPSSPPAARLHGSFSSPDVAPPPILEYTFSQLLTSAISPSSPSTLSLSLSLCSVTQALMLHRSQPLPCLPGGVRFRCSSPSCIPCPPPVKWLWHYTAGRAPSCRTASLSVRASIARAGRICAGATEWVCVHASVSASDYQMLFTASPMVRLWHVFFQAIVI